MKTTKHLYENAGGFDNTEGDLGADTGVSGFWVRLKRPDPLG
jgi:hypothetical protein